jgi:hypothetical protein
VADDNRPKFGRHFSFGSISDLQGDGDQAAIGRISDITNHDPMIH